MATDCQYSYTTEDVLRITEDAYEEYACAYMLAMYALTKGGMPEAEAHETISDWARQAADDVKDAVDEAMIERMLRNGVESLNKRKQAALAGEMISAALKKAGIEVYGMKFVEGSGEDEDENTDDDVDDAIAKRIMELYKGGDDA